MNSNTNIVRKVQALISGVHLDLIITAPSEDAEHLAHTLEEALKSTITHVVNAESALLMSYDRSHTVTRHLSYQRSFGPATLDTLDLTTPLPASAYPFACSNFDEGAA